MDQGYGGDEVSAIGSNTWSEQAMLVNCKFRERIAFFPIDGNPRHGLLVISPAKTVDSGLRHDSVQPRTANGVRVVEVFERLGQWRVMPRTPGLFHIPTGLKN
jgi:hypothetical protein